MNPVAVTGIGLVSPLGIGFDEFADSLAAGVTALDADEAGILVARVDGFNVADHLVAEKTYLDRTSEFALAAAKLCLDDAGLDAVPADDERRGLVLGTQYGCAGTMETYRERVQQRGMRFATPLLFSHAFANTPASLLAIDFRLRGYHATVTSGAGSGLVALHTALVALALDHADAVLVGASDALDQALIAALAESCLATDDPDAWDPFAADGRALGEGAAMLLLEPLERAEARGAEIRALLTAGAGGDLLLLPNVGLPADPEPPVSSDSPQPGVPASAPQALYGDALGAAGALAAAAAVACLRDQIVPPLQYSDADLASRRESEPMSLSSVTLFHPGGGSLRIELPASA